MNPLTLIGFGLSALGMLVDGGTPKPKTQLGRSPAPRAPPGSQPDPTGKIRGERRVSVAGIDERVGHLQRLIREGSLSPKVIAAARGVLTRKVGSLGNLRYAVAEKDWRGEVAAMFNALRDPNSPISMRYVRDHPEVDQFSTADADLRIGAGDCDDQTVILGALLRAVGYSLRVRIIQARGSASWSHVYLRCGLPPGQDTEWISLDATVNRPSGWEVSGAEEALRTGKPAGLVTRTKDYNV